MDCLLVHTDLTYEVHKISQSEATGVLGGPVTLVGALDDLNVFVAALQEPPEGATLHPLCTDPERFEGPVRGSILMVATGGEGEEMSVDVPSVLTWFKTSGLRPRLPSPSLL